MKSDEPVANRQNPLIPEMVKAIMIACFAYIGYAVGGLLLVAITRANVDVEAAGANFKMQFMFVVAFVVNSITIFWVARRWQAHRITLAATFLLFWLIDTLVPWLYQTFVFGSSFIPAVLMLGFFPATIITVGIRMNYRSWMRMDQVE